MVRLILLSMISLFFAENNSVNSETRLSRDSLIVLQFPSQIWNNTRGLRILLPKGYFDENNSRRYPVLYLNDGFSVINYWKAIETISNLEAEDSIEPFILVAIDNAIQDDNNNYDLRTNEYLPFPDPSEPGVPKPEGKKFPNFLIDEVMPFVNKKFRTKTDEVSTALGGSSYGSYIALYTMVTHPFKFGKLLLESTPIFIDNYKILELIDSISSRSRLISIGIGDSETPNIKEDSSIVEQQHKFADQLQSIYPYSEINFIVGKGASHNSKAWKERFRKHLLFLFGTSQK